MEMAEVVYFIKPGKTPKKRAVIIRHTSALMKPSVLPGGSGRGKAPQVYVITCPNDPVVRGVPRNDLHASESESPSFRVLDIGHDFLFAEKQQ